MNFGSNSFLLDDDHTSWKISFLSFAWDFVGSDSAKSSPDSIVISFRSYCINSIFLGLLIQRKPFQRFLFFTELIIEKQGSKSARSVSCVKVQIDSTFSLRWNPDCLIVARNVIFFSYTAFQIH